MSDVRTRERRGTRRADAPPSGAGRGRPRRGRLGLPRQLPWTSWTSRLWIGTKLVCLTALTTLLVLRPTWSSVAAFGAVLVAAALAARVPPSALPRFPAWVWAALIGGGVGAWIGQGFFIYLRQVLVAGLVLAGVLVLVWTSDMARLAPALRTLLAPLRLLRLPVDEWVATMALCMRGIPLLWDEMLALGDSARLRIGPDTPRHRDGRELGPLQAMRYGARAAIDFCTAALSAASRRAAETGRSMTQRGGVPPVPRERPRLTWRDALAVVASGAAIAAALVLRHGWPW